MEKSMQKLQEAYRKNQEKIIEDFLSFLKFESISSEPDSKPELLACLNWLADYIKKIGFDIQIWETVNHPVLFASWNKAGPNQPTLLIYNHYDVQPVDPLSEWTSPPFEPTIRNGEIFARGAQDNKGQLFYVIQALALLMKQDAGLPINVKLCIEGEEECGSYGLSSILREKEKELKADYLAVVDLGINSPIKPALTLGIRGIVTMDLEVSGTTSDLHSGAHGGLAFNPIHSIVNILNQLRDNAGRVLVPGFYDEVAPISDQEKKELSLDFDFKHYEEFFGAKPTGGEKEFSPSERNWLRPSLEINGISGGYSGSGFKTVIPAKAHAKISCRLVPNQNPDTVARAVAAFIEKIAPEGTKAKVTIRSGAGSAIRANSSSKVAAAFKKSFEEIFQAPCEFILAGGSIPIVTELAAVSKSELVLLGLGLPDDQIHAPNEHFGIDRLEKGCLIMAQALKTLQN